MIPYLTCRDAYVSAGNRAAVSDRSRSSSSDGENAGENGRSVSARFRGLPVAVILVVAELGPRKKKTGPVVPAYPVQQASVRPETLSSPSSMCPRRSFRRLIQLPAEVPRTRLSRPAKPSLTVSTRGLTVAPLARG